MGIFIKPELLNFSTLLKVMVGLSNKRLISTLPVCRSSSRCPLNPSTTLNLIVG